MNAKIKQLKQMAQDIKLLYVEDNENTRVTTLEMLKNLFFSANITVATDGVYGLKAFKEDNFDLVITDINMPNLNGMEMLKSIKKLNKEISILILSAYNETNYFLDAIELNVDGFILKPIVYKQFLASLQKVLKKISLEKKDKEYNTFLEDEIKARTQEIEQKLHYDALTGLLSRYSFFEDIKTIKNPILFMIDINKFRTINEIYGSEVGSLILQKFAQFLLDFASLRNYKTYRLASDEFTFLDVANHIDYKKYEDELNIFFKKLDNFSVSINNDSISIEATIGVSTSKQNPFESVKIALEYAKVHKQHYAIYSKDIDKRIEEKDALKWKDKIKTAIKTGNIVAVYQAIVNKHGSIIKYETLMRLKEDSNKKLITPIHFLDISIKTGLYENLSSYIVFQALKQIKDIQKTLSMNFTYSDIQNKSFIEDIENFMKENPTVGSLAIFEITESENIESYINIKNFIDRFKKYGVRFAIDDFGSGFSNFEYILEVEPDYLKIDGSLIKNIDIDEKALVLVRAIVQFSHELGIKTIAEYVHSKTIFNILKAINVDEYQGFYFHKPSPDILEKSIND